MLKVTQRFEGTRPADAPPADARLVIPFETRSRSRFRGRLDTGEWVGVVLARGQVLRGGDFVLASDGRVIEIGAAPETVSTASSPDARLLARAAYHLGNRHVALELGPGWLRYGHDHVLDDMVVGLGLTLCVEEAPFEPEGGAYGQGQDGGRYTFLSRGHSHAHGH
jgi:urease accessory protein